MDLKNWQKKLSNTKMFGNELLVFHKTKTTLALNKPAYGVMCILKLSKMRIYEFGYDYIKNKYGNKSR